MADLRVLVVDDEPVAVRGHRAYVERVEGFAVVGTAGSVREAVAVLQRTPVDLVLLDLNLPDGHGLDLARSLRASGRPVDILAITAAREVHLVRTAVALGVVGYLLKPFTFADLRERLLAYGRYRAGLAASEAASQGQVDAMFRELRSSGVGTAAGASLPKGLSPHLLEKVTGLVRSSTSADGLSASEVGAALGASRVTARRYLQHLAETGRVTRDERLGGSGRPEVTFRWVNSGA